MPELVKISPAAQRFKCINDDGGYVLRVLQRRIAGPDMISQGLLLAICGVQTGQQGKEQPQQHA